MKKLILTPLLALLLLGTGVLTAQNQNSEYLGLPGDNLNLFAVMNLFQESETLEGFERSLNDPKTMINNLDLNNDNLVDYIMVFDYKKGDLHNIVLRVALNEHEEQDVAVFLVEKLRNGAVIIQLIGDEALYGPNYIVEPVYAETPNPGYRGKAVKKQSNVAVVNQPSNVTVVHTTYYEVAQWPVIVYMHRPVYRPWRSTWRWGYHPVYWDPWTPHYYHFYYGYHYNWNTYYYSYYRPSRQPRSVHYHTVYHTHIRHHSPTVVVNVNRGSYRNTYSRPEKRSEGEVHFTQRHPERRELSPRNEAGTRVPARYNPAREASDNTRRTTRSDSEIAPSGGEGRSAGSEGVRRGTDRERGRENVTGSDTENNRTRATENNRGRVESTDAPRRADRENINNDRRPQSVETPGTPQRETPEVRPTRETRTPAGRENRTRTIESTPERTTPERTAPARSAPERTTPATRPSRVESTPTPVRESRPAPQPAREQATPARESRPAPQPAREQAAPARESRPAPQPAREQAAPARESRPAPQPARQQAAPARESRPAPQPAREQAAPARESRPSSPPPRVERSEPTRQPSSSAPAQARPAQQNNNRSTQEAPQRSNESRQRPSGNNSSEPNRLERRL